MRAARLPIFYVIEVTGGFQKFPSAEIVRPDLVFRVAPGAFAVSRDAGKEFGENAVLGERFCPQACFRPGHAVFEPIRPDEVGIGHVNAFFIKRKHP